MSKSVHEIDYAKDYDKWKKKYTKKKNKIKFCKKQPKVPEWQVEKNYINKLVKRYHEINVSEVVKFSDFPLSKNTLKGLLEAQYRTPTEIQKQTIGLALQGKDILGAAKTGSGKTLAFVVPVLECLYRQQWTAEEGLAVLIISPTRELAYQTFEVLRKVGKNHEFSAGLIIGGKDLKFEAERITRTNIIICTPGRLLQHMDETSYFYASNLQMLVLDEADRILDMGFAETMNAIIENLPKERQTLLFSATQTTSVKDLARLSLKDPEYVWVHEKAKFSTPATLEQNYIVCELHQKINMLFSFMKTHLKKKSIFFFASCKEVQFLFRVFCRLRPGIPVLALHGKQQQMKRMEVYNDFVRKKSAVLFATDIAARGLDFPAVNWVLQLDCPEDANTYIHRVGRTARYKEGGEALLVLLPSEEKGMVRQLEERKVPIKKIQINPEKILNVQQKLVAFLAQEQELKERAQRCFVSYLRSVFLMKNKEVFDVQKLPFTEYALSLGLAVAPRIRFLQKAWLHQRLPSLGGKDDRGAQNVPTTNEDGDASLGLYDELEEFKAQLKSQKAFTSSDTKETNVNTDREKQSGGSSGDDDIKAETPSDENLGNPKKDASKAVHFFGCENDNDQEEDDRDLDLLTLKRRNVFALEDGVSSEKKTIEVGPKKHVQVSKVKEAKKALKKKFKLNTKITFTEEGEMHQQWPPVQKTVVEYDSDESDTCGIIVEKAREKLKEEDRFDKEEYRKKIKAKHREKRLKEKAARRKLRKRKDSDEDEKVVFLKQSGSEDEFDPDTLPDPNKYKDSDQEGDKSSQEEKSSLVHEKAQRKRVYSLSSDNQEGENPQKRKKKIKPRKVQEFTPLDTGLSLAEDEELAIRLLMR